MTGPLPLGAITPDGRAFRVAPNQWILAVTHPDGPKDPLARHILLTMVVHWSNWDDGARMFAGREMAALASARNGEDVRQSLAYGYEEGWLWRYSVRGKRAKYKHYVYETTLPIAWLDRLGHLRDWEKDPDAIEEMLRTRKLERGKRKRRRKGRDSAVPAGNDRRQPAPGGDDGSRPPAECQSGTENHTVQGCTTSSSTPPVTVTTTSSDAKNGLQGIEVRLHGKRLRDAALRRPAHEDYATQMEKCLRRLEAEHVVLDLNKPEDLRLLRASCGLKTDAETISIIKQLADEDRIRQPLPVAAMMPTLEPHEEVAGSTAQGELPAAETPRAAEA